MARVNALSPIKYGAVVYAPAGEIDGLTNAQAEELAAAGAATILELDAEPAERTSKRPKKTP